MAHNARVRHYGIVHETLSRPGGILAVSGIRALYSCNEMTTHIMKMTIVIWTRGGMDAAERIIVHVTNSVDISGELFVLPDDAILTNELLSNKCPFRTAICECNKYVY